MRRFKCPGCRQSLSLRLLPFAGMVDNRITFACVHCGKKLTYNEPDDSLLGLLWKTKLHSLFTNISGVILFLVLAEVGSVAIARAVWVLIALVILGSYLFASEPAYKLVEPDKTMPDHQM